MVRFGLIGYGLWGQHHAAAIAKAPGAELAAISCTEDSVAAARQAFPNVPIYLDYKDLLARSDIDAVDIVVPNHLHCEVGCAALNARKDVLLEKPMALSVTDCDRLVDAARNNGRVLTIGHEFRLSEQWGLFKDMIQGGEIGRPLYANVSLFRFPYRPGGGAWRYQPGQVGSWTLEEPVHFFDFLMWYFEPWGDPVSVLGLGSAKEGRSVGMNDNFTAIVRWPGQLYAVVTQTLAGFEHHHVVEIVGSEGSIRSWWSGSMDRTREAAYEIKVQRKGQKACEVINIAASGELFELEEELRRAVKAFEAREAIVSGEDARKRIIVCLEAERSLIEGKEIGLKF